VRLAKACLNLPRGVLHPRNSHAPRLRGCGDPLIHARLRPGVCAPPYPGPE
jgi:hypothetical protein